jgi:hypothetical protein
MKNEAKYLDWIKLDCTELDCTVICYVSVSAKFGICTVVDLNGTLVEAKICTHCVPSGYFSFIKTHDGANAKFSFKEDNTDYSVDWTLDRHS